MECPGNGRTDLGFTFSKCVSSLWDLCWLTSLMYCRLCNIYDFHMTSVTVVTQCTHAQVWLSNRYVYVCISCQIFSQSTYCIAGKFLPAMRNDIMHAVALLIGSTQPSASTRAVRIASSVLAHCQLYFL